MEFEPITTREAFDSAVAERISANTAEVEKRFEGYMSPDDVQKNNDALNQQIADLTAKNKAYEVSAIKRKVAIEKGLPEELIERLTGETEEEIKADAENLSKFSVKKKPTPSFSGDKPVSDVKSAAYMSMLHSLNNK